SHATYKKQSKNRENVTEFQEIENRGHSLTIDSGWQQVAQASLDFVSRFAK
ncbi:MAG: non-heme chloroperoxidase, partial [Mycobacterium sp.]|nr:non-heme chloroperoxidase [Mycobacterium sp.]